MTMSSLRALLLLCLVLGVYLWFRRVWTVMKARHEAVEVAARQRQTAEDSAEPSPEAFAAVLARSENIYAQAVERYEQALHRPLYHLPAVMMGFRSVKEDDPSERV